MKTLIIKLGALGDVVRTTVVLRELKGEICWLTKSNASDLLRSDKISKVYFYEKINPHTLANEEFDLVISLDEEKEALDIISLLKFKRLIGIYRDEHGQVVYTPESAYWFDMSLSSRFGKKKADALKLKNKKSVPQILIEMLGKKFTGQEYDLGVKPESDHRAIGLIDVVTSVWPNKAWHGYASLKESLKKSGKQVVVLGMKPTLAEHIDEINKCGVIVCGDTLGLHIALALKKQVVALFNCTSPDEIYDYRRMKKIVSPLYKECFYKKDHDPKVISSIPVETVYKEVMKIANGS